ncbi:hypothetical protein [Bradyrhizobium liaoningense]|uniref:hypothetical protein n=1 Tax=Bradyrhizobium liaoningense TaxID=43992 RepID=UPI001BA4B877|nr:hypothetical protein [Bradyrhizobium liaoningense]MBR1066882.1 hypothetical protein [Bradyrhizobium liaoningense]
MTTSQSPLRVLKAQANNMARIMKAIERGEKVTEDVGGKLAASLAVGVAKVAIAMDDKVIILDIAWSTVKTSSEVALGEYVLGLMRGSRETKH